MFTFRDRLSCNAVLFLGHWQDKRGFQRLQDGSGFPPFPFLGYLQKWRPIGSMNAASQMDQLLKGEPDEPCAC